MLLSERNVIMSFRSLIITADDSELDLESCHLPTNTKSYCRNGIYYRRKDIAFASQKLAKRSLVNNVITSLLEGMYEKVRKG